MRGIIARCVDVVARSPWNSLFLPLLALSWSASLNGCVRTLLTTLVLAPRCPGPRKRLRQSHTLETISNSVAHVCRIFPSACSVRPSSLLRPPKTGCTVPSTPPAEPRAFIIAAGTSRARRGSWRNRNARAEASKPDLPATLLLHRRSLTSLACPNKAPAGPDRLRPAIGSPNLNIVE